MLVPERSLRETAITHGLKVTWLDLAIPKEAHYAPDTATVSL